MTAMAESATSGAAPHDEQRWDVVTARLLARFGDPVADPPHDPPPQRPRDVDDREHLDQPDPPGDDLAAVIEAMVAREAARFREATVQAFVPILVERNVARFLQPPDPVAGAGRGRPGRR